jgi:hypothetical protein
MANQANGNFGRGRNQPAGETVEMPPWGTPPEVRRPGEPGYGLEPELEPKPTHLPSPQYAEASQGVLALVLGLIGLFAFPPVAPAAWIIGRREVRAVNHGRRNPRHRTLGQLGLIFGIVGTVVLAVGVVLLGLVLALVFAAFSALL